ncbi:hypothetical protein L1987_53386 [Smallanthus sonchifolius]|uniref:Uncharacterized protein n=1 Tax=Smallanthus sonchifolius TaxID=185202 RepID=A0ACB9EWE1_9ASTR|nr:hypothetical protein L1987_53386 [Smallanthus sonchifolius]
MKNVGKQLCLSDYVVVKKSHHLIQSSSIPNACPLNLHSDFKVFEIQSGFGAIIADLLDLFEFYGAKIQRGFVVRFWI